MGKEAAAPMRIPSFLRTNPTSSSSIQFLSLLTQPDSDPIPSLELEESDVVWSSSFSSTSDLSSSPTAFGSASYSPPDRYRHRLPETRPFMPERSGLSAALADDSLLSSRLPPTFADGGLCPSFFLCRAAAVGFHADPVTDRNLPDYWPAGEPPKSTQDGSVW